MSNNLFKEFELISDSEWKEKVLSDLKGKNFEETLIWNDEDQIKHKPYYRSSDLRDNDKVEAIQSAQRLDKSWKILEELESKRDLIQEILSEDITLEDIKAENFENGLVDGNFYKERGATIVQELSFSVCKLIELIDVFTNKGKSVDEVIEKLEFHLGISNSYFLEIAKYRAFRYLIKKVYVSLSVTKQPFVIAKSSDYYLSTTDMHNNLLRLTSQAMSAIIGGCDALYLNSFDHFGKNSKFGERLARNIQLILKNESHFDKIIDPASGSYYVESITIDLVNKAWDLIQSIEKDGGIISFSKSGKLDKMLKESREQRVRFYKENRTMVGVNRFKNKEGIDGVVEGVYNLSKSLEL